MARRNHPGLTLLEVVLASALLVAAAVPILNAATRAVTLAQEIDWRTRATFLAQREMENVLAVAAENYSQDFTRNSADLGDRYRVTVQQSLLTALKKKISVRVGRDKNGNAILDDGEVLATLGTIVANRGN
jgi:Tfp pilus assembly protein PilV